MITIYGIKACDTMKKARNWLEDNDLPYQFHDYKVSGIHARELNAWCDRLGWEKILNRSGTTFRKLEPHEREGLDRDHAVALMQRQPSMIRRPVLSMGNILLVGFRPEEYATVLLGRN